MLASAPLNAPLLFSEGETLPAASLQALRALHPLGAPALGGAQVIRIGTQAAVPEGLRTRDVVTAGGPANVAAAIERLLDVTHAGAHAPSDRRVSRCACRRFRCPRPASRPSPAHRS